LAAAYPRIVYARRMRLFSTDPNEPGIFAVGQLSVGIFALGQLSLGIVAIGQLARGVFAFGQLAVGVVAIGQGAVGLFHGTGMVALAGQRGFGIVLHSLPRLVAEPAPPLAPPMPVSDIVAGDVPSGWIPARLVVGPAGPRVIPDDGKDLEVDVLLVRAELLAGVARGCDRAHLRVRREVAIDQGGYRQAHREVTLVAEQVVVYPSRRPRHLAYGRPPAGRPGAPATGVEIAFRTLAFVIAVAIVSVTTFWPLAEALF
jgi:hypothetical protein